MFSTVLQELKGYFGRDFFLAVFFPTFTFMGVSSMIVLELVYGLGNVLVQWEKLALQTQSIILLSWTVAVATFSYMIYNYLYVITRLFEGYWSRVPLLAMLRDPRVKVHKRRWEHLSELAQSAGTVTLESEIRSEQLAFYPPPGHTDKMMPTLLGNILRAAEIYAYDRYGIEPTVIWSRMRPLLKPEALAALEDKQTSMNFSIIMTLFFSSFTIIWCTALAVLTTRWGLFLVCAAGWPLAWFSYRNAIQSALAYSDQVTGVFDLYRHDLLKALNRAVPRELGDERKEWRRLTHFFYRNVPLPAAAPTPPPQAEGIERLAGVLAAYFENQVAAPATGDGTPPVRQ